MHLILFDIDATLISTSGVGIRAMEESGRALFGESFSSGRVEYAGRLDPLIVRDLLIANGIDPTPANMLLLRDGYRGQLARKLPETPSARSLPGVPALLDALEHGERAALGRCDEEAVALRYGMLQCRRAFRTLLVVIEIGVVERNAADVEAGDDQPVGL
jgi:hypothetical protein